MCGPGAPLDVGYRSGAILHACKIAGGAEEEPCTRARFFLMSPLERIKAGLLGSIVGFY